MTQVQSIQQNIHYTKTQLNKSRRVVIKDDLHRLHIQGSIDNYLTELKELKTSLKRAVANTN